MLKDFPEVQQWMEESRADGEMRGRLAEAREVAERLLTARFVSLSPAALEFLELRTRDELHDLAVRAIEAPDLRSLGVPE